MKFFMVPLFVFRSWIIRGNGAKIDRCSLNYNITSIFSSPGRFIIHYRGQNAAVEIDEKKKETAARSYRPEVPIN